MSNQQAIDGAATLCDGSQPRAIHLNRKRVRTVRDQYCSTVSLTTEDDLPHQSLLPEHGLALLHAI